MCYVQCCLFFEEKNRVFIPQDMLKHIQGTKVMIIFSKNKPEGRGKFLCLFAQIA